MKDVLQWLLGFPKWVLHLLLGGGLFFVALATLVLARLPPRRAARLSTLAILLLAVGVEVLDALDAATSGKTFTTSGSLEDILVTCLLPVAALVFDQVGSPPHREPKAEERRHRGDGMATP